MTPQLFAEALLHRLGLPVSDNNVIALVAAQVIEGGHAHNSALYNPMNTTYDLGDSPVAQGFSVPAIRAYKNWDEGLEATARTLTKGKPAFGYGPILDALRRSAPPDETLKAMHASAWGWGNNPIAAAKAYLPHAKDEYPAKGGGPLGFLWPTRFMPAIPNFTTVFAVGAVALGAALIIGYAMKPRRPEPARRFARVFSGA